MKVGIIGIGTMGKPMAANILKAGHTLSIYARNPEKAKALEAQGAKVVASPAEVAAASDAVVLSLPFDPEVEEVVLGSRGVAEGAKPGLLILDTTTGSTKGAIQVAERLRPLGIAYLDAPVSGGVKGAVEGTMTFLVGGDKSDVERATPLMNCMGGHIHHLGPVGAGRGLKALVQIIAAMNTLTLCEAVVLGKRLGIEPTRFYEALSDTAANSYHLQSKLPNFIIPGHVRHGPPDRDDGEGPRNRPADGPRVEQCDAPERLRGPALPGRLYRRLREERHQRHVQLLRLLRGNRFRKA